MGGSYTCILFAAFEHSVKNVLCAPSGLLVARHLSILAGLTASDPVL